MCVYLADASSWSLRAPRIGATRAPSLKGGGSLMQNKLELELISKSVQMSHPVSSRARLSSLHQPPTLSGMVGMEGSKPTIFRTWSPSAPSFFF